MFSLLLKDLNFSLLSKQDSHNQGRLHTLPKSNIDAALSNADMMVVEIRNCTVVMTVHNYRHYTDQGRLLTLPRSNMNAALSNADMMVVEIRHCTVVMVPQ